MSKSHMDLRLKDLARSHSVINHSASNSGSWDLLLFASQNNVMRIPQPILIPAIAVSSPLSVHLMHLPGFGFPMQRSDVSYCSITSPPNPPPPPPPSTSVEDLLVQHAAMQERLLCLSNLTSCTIPQCPTTSCCRTPRSATVRQPEPMAAVVASSSHELDAIRYLTLLYANIPRTGRYGSFVLGVCFFTPRQTGNAHCIQPPDN
jgi:hypothetical protein